jgi:hypothetical protein
MAAHWLTRKLKPNGSFGNFGTTALTIVAFTKLLALEARQYEQ